MNRFLPIATVLLVIVALWYGLAVRMNAPWVYDQAARAEQPAPGFGALVGLTRGAVAEVEQQLASQDAKQDERSGAEPAAGN